VREEFLFEGFEKSDGLLIEFFAGFDEKTVPQSRKQMQLGMGHPFFQDLGIFWGH
jgi:hypothetical protein